VKRRAGWTAALLAAVHFGSFYRLDGALHTDVRYFLYFAQRIADGAVPYADLLDPKTPLASIAGAFFVLVGRSLDVDPLSAIRCGYLALATLGGWLLFQIHRILGGSDTAGILGLLAGCSFGLLGVMPSLGNVPKLLMVLGASGAALLAHHGRWTGAGALAALAFLDWQVGGLAGIGVAVAAAAQGRRELARAALGGALVLLIAAGALAAAEGLEAGLAQVFGSAAARGSDALQARPFPLQVAYLGLFMARVTGPQIWLCGLSLLGMAVLLRRLRMIREPLVVVLAVYHFGVVAFSLVDFQGEGDAFALLHTLGLFLGLLWVALLPPVAAWLTGRVARPPRVAAGLVLAAAALAARPGPLRPAIDHLAYLEETTLTGQRQVAAAVDELIGAREVLALDTVELLFLLGRSGATDLAYWNAAAASHHCQPTELERDCLRRVVAESGATAVLLPPRPAGQFRADPAALAVARPRGAEWTDTTLWTPDGGYGVVVYLREERP